MKPWTLKQIQEGLLKILIDVDRFCSTHNIRYSIAYGTLLGAVRHKGFIPWDDDVDLLMPREDFEKFVKLYNSPNYKCLYNYSRADYHFVSFYAKVIDCNTICYENRQGKNKLGLNIDIFPVDGKPTNKAEQLKHEKLLCHLAHRLYLRQQPLFPPSLHNPIFSNIQAHSHSLDYWVNKTLSCMQKYNFNTSKFCGAVPTSYNGTIEVFPKDMFLNYIDLDFEGLKFKAFKDWELFLVQQFNDYMTIPPVRKRHNHNLVVYSKK